MQKKYILVSFEFFFITTFIAILIAIRFYEKYFSSDWKFEKY
ncbi:hypothetical protein BN863_600 [Formosa agariphila KMM 3901]|uniref:Uncharacterized protein n=1 Tax=Formosa agariphila (strain DSM 15362 / KCTC 12365 / LMG 23005 / KMM 3901 / M-2Alg 35-1) TaxID=1347342 RepID=T2KGA6_FORAG|nr:hypothetical protein BN863_600 [Formosa agariphila KMM 3901]